MDIKFISVQVFYFLAILALVVDTTYAGIQRRRGSGRVVFRNHNRREVRDYLAPPSQYAPYTSYGPPPSLIPYRPGRFVEQSPSTEAPGYFSRLASWLNPFGGSPTPPPLPEIEFTKSQSSYSPSQAYGPPPQSYGPPMPQPPPAGPDGYLPPKDKGKNCNPCNNVPWIPLPGIVQGDNHGAGDSSVEIQPSINQELTNQGGDSGSSFSHAEEIRPPDFSYGPPSEVPSGNHYSGPIPYPHLYPGPMPPLFKSRPFNPPVENFQPTPLIPVESGPPDHPVDSLSSGDGHVEVLPPGAEIDTSGDGGEIRDTPPPGYEDNIANGYESSGLNIQQSTTIHEEHLNTEVNAGYKVQPSQTTASVEVFKSVPTAEFSDSINYPISYEQSPIIDLTRNNQNGGELGNKDYGAGLHPPPLESVQSYNVNRVNGGADFSKDAGNGANKDSYGIPVSSEPPRDSFVASTVTNQTFSHSTPSYVIPDVGGLPLSHETVKPTGYENYPPSTEKFLINVSEASENLKTTSNNGAQQSNGSTQEQQGNNDQSKIVDSYQQQIEHSFNGPDPNNGQLRFLNTPEPLVPYRPSSLYVPYPPYSGPHLNPNGLSSTEPSGFTTEEPFLEALMKSYNNFKQEMAAKDQLLQEHREGSKTESKKNQTPPNSGSSGGLTWVSQPVPSISIPEQINTSDFISGHLMPPPLPPPGINTNQQQSGGKRNKQVQIIIPYTSQYTPSPFQPVADDWSGRGPLEQTQGRKVPVLGGHDQNHVGEESKKVEVTRPLKPLQNLLIKEVAKKPTIKPANNSIDVLRLQKNIDNWTIQEYSRGITSSTALPSSSHPYLLQSKKIPKEYLRSNHSSVSEERIDKNQPDLPGFNYNDLEHEGAASSRVDVPHVRVLSVGGVPKSSGFEIKPSATVLSTETMTSSSYFSSSASPSTSTSATPSPFTSTSTTTTQASWLELPVSISPHNNERVYVVTPQPVRSLTSRPRINDIDKSGKFEAIERAYQVLPQAVNNLASTSVSGPEHVPLWGIMEHDQYARNIQENTTTSVPILYAGHSKVSNAKSH